jgi:hypothetical protein
MVRIQVSLVSDSGMVVVNANYVSGSNPVWLDRVVVEELNGQGGVIGTSTHRVGKSLDPVPGSTQLFSVPPSGSNVRGMRATLHFLEVDKSERSTVLSL